MSIHYYQKCTFKHNPAVKPANHEIVACIVANSNEASIVYCHINRKLLKEVKLDCIILILCIVQQIIIFHFSSVLVRLLTAYQYPRFGYCACLQFRSCEKGTHHKKQSLKDIWNLSLSLYCSPTTNFELQHYLQGALFIEMKFYTEKSSPSFLLRLK